MTTGDEQQPLFDPVAAAEMVLRQGSDAGQYAFTGEDVAADHAEVERQQPLVAALGGKGIQLDLAEGQTLLDKSVEMTIEVDRLREKQDTLAARQIAGDERPEDDDLYDELRRQTDKALREGERVDIAHYIDEITLDPEPTRQIEHIESTIAGITASKLLTPEEKKAYLDVLEASAGQGTFSKAMENVQKGTGLEQSLGRIAAEENRTVVAIEELQDIQTALIYELGIDDINHKDWLPFTQNLHRITELQRRDTPEARIMLRVQQLQLQETAERLGLSSEMLGTIFSRFNIEDTGND